MNEQNSVLNIIGKVSGFLSKYIAVVILITSAVAFTHTQNSCGFRSIPLSSWARQCSAWA